MNSRILYSLVSNDLSVAFSFASLVILHYISRRLFNNTPPDRLPLDNRLFLQRNYTREDIVNMGREAIRDHKTKKLLKNPVVKDDGYSYEKEESTDVSVPYENRMLKEFIQKYTTLYKPL